MTRKTHRVTVNILGPPQILLAGVPLSLNHQKASALLFFLAATGHAHTRDYLATLLWSETSTTNARHSLRSSLYRLRQAIQREKSDEILASDGDLIYLQPDTYECDLSKFHHMAAAGDEQSLSRAVGLYRGSLLQGFTLTEAPVFEEWVRREETRLNQAYLDALDHLATMAESREAWATAIGYLQQMVQIDPLAEAAQQRLMRLYLQRGEAGLALRQYRQFEDQLRKDLDISPSLETQALLHDALRQQSDAPSYQRNSSSSAIRQPNNLPFVGRNQLLQQLRAISKQVGVGQGATILVEGEGGIGKTRLLDELASELISEPSPWLVLRGACSPFDDLRSQGPFLEALDHAKVGDLTDLLAESEASVPDARGRFSWGVLQRIRYLSKSIPLLFVIEDLQWANSSTLNLFGFLTMRLHQPPVMLVGTVQHAEAIPALQRLITLGRRRHELHFFSLAPLPLDAVSELLRKTGLSPTSVESMVEWLHAKSGGNPFLLTEIMAQLRTDAILRPEETNWQLDTARWLRWRSFFKLPETTHDLVSWRLANLTPNVRYLLDVLAVSGGPLSVNVLRDFPGVQQDSFFASIDDLIARGLTIELPDNMLSLPHHLLRETLLHRLSNIRRRSINKQLAEALEKLTMSDSKVHLQQLALYSVAGEDIERARRYGMQVVANLPQEYTGAETVDFVQHLYDLLASTASTREMIQLTHALGTLHQSLGHLELATRWYEQNLTLAQAAGNLTDQADVHFEISELALMSNNYVVAVQAAQEGLSKVQTGENASTLSPGLALLMGRGHRLLGAGLAMDGNNLNSAEDHLQKAVTMYKKSGNQADLCAALFELGNIAAQRGELKQALNLYKESAAAAQTGSIYYYLALARNNFAYHSLLLGEIDAARQSAAHGIKVAESYDLLAALLHLYSTMGEIHLYLGEWEEAEESFQSGLTIAEELGSLERQSGYRGGLALSARGQKKFDIAIQLLEEALALIEGQGHRHLHTRLQLWLAETFVEQKRLDEAMKPLEEALKFARTQERTLLLVQGERLRASILAACGDWPSAHSLFTETLQMAYGLDLPLEIARVKAAWGKAALQYSPAPDNGRALMDDAYTIFVSHKSQSDLFAF